MRRPMGATGILVIGLLTACAVAQPTTTPRPSFLQNCAPTTPEAPPALTCDQAIAAALGALAPNHPRIVKVEFHYGIPCDPSTYCPLGAPDVGYVIVQMAAPDSDEWIVVVRNPDGSVTTLPSATVSPSP
jgi:hypothetical protein